MLLPSDTLAFCPLCGGTVDDVNVRSRSKGMRHFVFSVRLFTKWKQKMGRRKQKDMQPGDWNMCAAAVAIICFVFGVQSSSISQPSVDRIISNKSSIQAQSEERLRYIVAADATHASGIAAACTRDLCWSHCGRSALDHSAAVHTAIDASLCWLVTYDACNAHVQRTQRPHIETDTRSMRRHSYSAPKNLFNFFGGMAFVQVPACRFTCSHAHCIVTHRTLAYTLHKCTVLGHGILAPAMCVVRVCALRCTALARSVCSVLWLCEYVRWPLHQWRPRMVS